jgi:hypothetical protein
MEKNKPNTQRAGHHRGLSAPTSIEATDQLCLFVRYGKKAGVIRLNDSSVSEVELCDESPEFYPESTLSSVKSLSVSKPSSIRKSLSFSESIASTSKPKSKWILPSNLYVPKSEATAAGSLYFLTKGFTTHILPFPLPNPINSKRPFKIISWTSPPSAVLPRIITYGPSYTPILQVVGLGAEGAEVQEFSFSFLYGGKESISGEPLVKAYQDIGTAGFLSLGGSWHRGKQNSASNAQSSSQDEGFYGWVTKGYQDWRVIWIGGNGDRAINPR